MLDAKIARNLNDPDTIFVFPSEVGARFWIRRSLEQSDRSALRAGRFISWDDFKAQVFSYTKTRPVNRSLRTLFISALVEKNRRQLLFRQLINPAYRDSAAASIPSLRKILPSLNALDEHKTHWSILSAEKRTDLEILLREYSTFLQRTGRFEPNFENAALDTGQQRYVLFFTDTLEDFSAFEPLLRTSAQIEIVPFSRELTEKKLTVFENSVEEIRNTLIEIGRLLDRDIPAERIAVTIANLEELEPLLSREAELLEIPLTLHRGLALARYSGTRVFRQIGDCVRSGFSLTAFEHLLLNKALPWKSPERNRALIRFAAERGVVKTTQNQEQWREAFEKAQRCGRPVRALENFFIKLTRQLKTVVQAESFSALKNSLTRFSQTFLDESLWSTPELNVFQFALQGLDELAQADEAVPEALSSTPFRLWIDTLEERIYVQREPHCGVPVYPYRVSAGIYPQYHFIINAAQTATTQISRRFPFLSVHEEALLSDTTLDLSDRIIALYLCSGTQISISYARRSFSGSQLPPAFFVTHNSEIETRLQPIDSLYQKEIQLWTGSRWSGSPCSDGHNLDGHSLTDLYDIQKKGFQAALTSVLAGPDINYTLRPIDKKPLRNRITDRYRHEDLLRISASSLETFTACAFRSLLQRGLKLKAWTDGQPLLEPIEIGTLLHRVFQSFFEDLDAALSGHKLEDFRQRMKDRVASILEQYVRCRPLPLLPLWQALEQWITELSQAYLEVEIAEYPDWKTLDTEKTLDWILPEKIQLTGTIDRIMEREGERALVDYKKKNLPSRGDLSGPRANSFQMPVYLALMEANGKPVQRALYYSIENKKYRTVTAPKGSGRMMVEAEDLPGLNKNMMDRVRDMADRINRGDYSIAGRMDTKACRYCDFEAVCRKKYSF